MCKNVYIYKLITPPSYIQFSCGGGGGGGQKIQYGQFFLVLLQRKSFKFFILKDMRQTKNSLLLATEGLKDKHVHRRASFL